MGVGGIRNKIYLEAVSVHKQANSHVCADRGIFETQMSRVALHIFGLLLSSKVRSTRINMVIELQLPHISLCQNSRYERSKNV